MLAPAAANTNVTKPMTPRTRRVFPVLVALLSLFSLFNLFNLFSPSGLAFSLSGLAPADTRGQGLGDTLPKQLSDRAFWGMVTDFSESGGVFPSDNLLSNESNYQNVVPELQKRAQTGGVYLGVGPDQNFTYITAIHPRMAFIIDIRRQNLIEHLLYKALVEMSDNRADFLSRLFSRPRPRGLSTSSPPSELFRAYGDIVRSETLFQKNLQSVLNRLVNQHGFQLTTADRQNLEYVYHEFFMGGPDLRYTFPRPSAVTRWLPTYAQLMTATDRAGLNHSYLANEQNFRTLQGFERKNLLVPIVGDFGGDKAIRAISRYLLSHGATVDCFYTSNVEQYLFQSDAWQRYYANVAMLPLDASSTFVRAYFDAGFVFPPGIVTPDLHSTQLLDPVLDLLNAVHGGKIHTYLDIVER